MPELLGAVTATLLTLAIFSRVWRANAAFRAAEYLLLGLLGGYIAAVVLRTVLLPGLALPQTADPGPWIPWLLLIVLIVLLALRFARQERARRLGLLPLALMLGAGGALVLAGALRGTLAPQLLAPLSLSYLPAAPASIDALTVIIATLTTISVLVAFQRRARGEDQSRSALLSILGAAGTWALMIAFGALLATTAGARITLLIERAQYLISVWSQLLQ